MRKPLHSLIRFIRKSERVLATKWRHDLATGVSPWNGEHPRFRVLKGRHEFRCWQTPAVPPGLITLVHSEPRADARGYNMPSRWDSIAVILSMPV